VSCSNPHKGISSTIVTPSHVTEVRVEYEFKIHRGTDEVLDLWDVCCPSMLFVMIVDIVC